MEIIQNAGKLLVCPPQIKLVNEVLSGNRKGTEILIISKEQMKEFDGLMKMQKVLNSSERHGAVVPLSIYSKEFGNLNRAQYEAGSKYLSDYRVIPYIESLPVLIKVEMFERFGLLDESFQSMLGALIDFSLRFNQYGWSTVRANCWSDDIVCSEKPTEKDKDAIQKRYPYVYTIEEIYYMRVQRAVEHFVKVLVLETPHKLGLLFSLYEVPPSFNGTANYALKLLETFWSIYHDKYEISILVKKSTDEFYRISEKYPRVYDPKTVRNHTFHLGYVASQVLCAEHMDIINRSCLKYCVCMLDIICLRSHYLCKNDINRFDLFRDSIKYADLVLSISRFSHDDICAFFHDELQDFSVRTGFIYLGSDKEALNANQKKTIGPFQKDEYFIVIGNAYKHKMIEPTLKILRKIEENFIVVGTKTEGYYSKSKRIYGYVSGWLDHNSLDQMIADSKGIIFPSVYEGFGLTLYDAMIYRKKIYVSDIQINLELIKLFEAYSDRIITYRRLEELKIILSDRDSEDNRYVKSVPIRNWEETAKELDLWIESMWEEEIDVKRLEDRWEYLKRYQDEYRYVPDQRSNVRLEWLVRKCISCFPRIYKLYRKVVTVIDKEHYGSH